MPKFQVGSFLGYGDLIGLGLHSRFMEVQDGLGQLLDSLGLPAQLLSLGEADCLDAGTEARTHDLDGNFSGAGVLGFLEPVLLRNETLLE